MTLKEYPREAVTVLEANGMTWTRIMKDVLKTSDRRGFEQLLDGEWEATLLTLERLEAASGVSLDEVDERIHRGEALAGVLWLAARDNKWTKEALAAALGITTPNLNAVMNLGRLGAFAKPAHAIRLCDIVEGRVSVLPVHRKTPAEKAEQKRAFLSLPPEARGDSNYLVARRAFWKCVGSSPKLFRLRRAEGDESLFLANGPAIDYRFLVNGERVRFTAQSRRSGYTFADRMVWV